MKFLSIASGVALAIAGAAAQITSPMQDYNVTSPVANFPYVAGQILPVTYQIFGHINSAVALSISLKATIAGSNATYTISGSADVSKSGASAKIVKNVTVYEHSYNYNIPVGATPGTYDVVFLDTATNTAVNVPINILTAAAAATSSAAAAAGSNGASSTGGADLSVYKNAAGLMTPSKAILSIAAVAAAAYML